MRTTTGKFKSLNYRDLQKEVDRLRQMFAQEIKQVERKYETALNEFKNFQVQKAEFEQKGREKKAETLTEIKDTSNMNTVSNVNTSVRPSTIAKPLAREPPSQDPSGDSDFDRAED
jgi:hypothetical protein